MTSAHGYWFELPFAGGAIEAVDGASLWIRTAMGKEVVQVDPTSGEVGLRIQSPTHGRVTGPTCSVVADRLAHPAALGAANNLKVDFIVAFDTGSGREVWRQPAGRLVGTTDEGFLCADKQAGRVRFSVLRGADGTILNEVRSPGTFLWSDPIPAIRDGRLFVANDSDVVALELQTGRTLWTTPLAENYEPIVIVAGELMVSQNGNSESGRITRWSRVDPNSGFLSEAFVTDEWVRGCRGGDFLLLQSGPDNGPMRARAVAIDGAVSPTVECESTLTARRGRGAAAGSGMVVCFEQVNDRFRVARFPFPTSSVSDLAATDAVIYVLQEERLFVVEWPTAHAFDSETVHDLDAVYRPMQASRPTTADPAPGHVVFAGDSLMLVNHPRLGRLKIDRHPGDPVARKGDLIYLDEVLSDGGNTTVRIWHTAGTPAPTRRPPQPIRLDGSTLSPVEHARGPDSGTDTSQQIIALTRRIGVSAEPGLLKFAAVFDANPRLRDWTDQLSFQFGDIGGHTGRLWEGSDPSLIELASDGGGNVFALYYYPPADDNGRRLPVVLWDHETNEVDWLAPDFATFLHGFLAEAREQDSELVALACHALDIGTLQPAGYRTASPSWFVAAHDDSPTTLELARSALKTDPLQAERMLVKLFRSGHETTPELSELLAETFRHLGWTYHLDSLAAQNG